MENAESLLEEAETEYFVALQENKREDAGLAEYLSNLEDPLYLWDMTKEEVEREYSFIRGYLKMWEKASPTELKKYSEMIARYMSIQSHLEYMLKP